jgi:hypothetical protein
LPLVNSKLLVCYSTIPTHAVITKKLAQRTNGSFLGPTPSCACECVRLFVLLCTAFTVRYHEMERQDEPFIVPMGTTAVSSTKPVSTGASMKSSRATDCGNSRTSSSCFTSLLNLRLLIFGLIPFVWLRSVTLKPTTGISFFDLRPISGTRLGCKRRGQYNLLHSITCLILPVNCKDKARPRTGHEGPEEEVYSSALSLTSALDIRGRSTPPGRFTNNRYPLYRRLGGSQGRYGRVRKISDHRDSIPGPSSP